MLTENIEPFVVGGSGDGLEVGGELFGPVPFGIALRPGSPLREQVDTAMLDMLTDGTYDRMLSSSGGRRRGTSGAGRRLPTRGGPAAGG